MNIMLQRFGIPEHRETVEDRPVFAKRHVVGQPGPGQWHRDIVRDLPCPVNNAVMHIGRMFGVIEKHQFAGAIIHLGVRRDAVQRHPRCDALLLQRFRVQHIALAAHIEG